MSNLLGTVVANHEVSDVGDEEHFDNDEQDLNVANPNHLCRKRERTLVRCVQDLVAE